MPHKMERNYSLDLIRCTAILLVMVDHTFKLGDMSLPQASIRNFSLAGVPLFLMLTGYLNSHKTLEDYYVCGKWRTSLRVLFAYVVLGSICYVGGNMFDGKAVTIKDFVLKLFAFRLTPYGWYIEMWVGLFFLTPFLNMMVAQLTRKSEQILLSTLLFFTCLASFLNRNGTNLLPNFWVTLYPITIYFLGHYVSQYRVALSRFVCLGYIYLIVMGEPLLNRLFHTDHYLYFYGGQDNVLYVTLGLILFIMMKDVKLKNVKIGGGN